MNCLIWYYRSVFVASGICNGVYAYTRQNLLNFYCTKVHYRSARTMLVPLFGGAYVVHVDRDGSCERGRLQLLVFLHFKRLRRDDGYERSISDSFAPMWSVQRGKGIEELTGGNKIIVTLVSLYHYRIDIKRSVRKEAENTVLIDELINKSVNVRNVCRVFWYYLSQIQYICSVKKLIVTDVNIEVSRREKYNNKKPIKPQRESG